MGLIDKLETLDAAESVKLLRSDACAEEAATGVLPRMLEAHHIRANSALASELAQIITLMYRLGYDRGKMVKNLNKMYKEDGDELA